MFKRIIIAVSVCLIIFSCSKPEAVPAVPEEEQKEDPVVDPVPGPVGFEEEPDDKAKDVVKTFDYSVLAASGHPRLLLGEKDFESIKTRVTNDRFANPSLYKMHSVVLNRAAELVKTDIDVQKAGHETIVERLLAFSYAYRMTGSAAYLAKAKEEFEIICAMANWGSSFLAVGELGLAVAVTYDWLYYDLPLIDRKFAHKALVDNCITPSMSNSYVKDIGNWNQVGNAGAICAALAIYEKDKARAVNCIEAHIVDNKKAMEIIYGGGGGYPEGIGYWDYGTTSEVIFLQSLERIFGSTGGLKEVSGFLETGGFGLFAHGAQNTTFSFADGGSTNDQSVLASWWFAATKKDASLAFAEKHLLDAGLYASSYKRLTPMAVCFLKDFDIDAAGIAAPAVQTWTCDGQMPLFIVRRGWEYSASDVYLGIKGGDCDTWKSMNTSHGHMDAGSFVFEADGVRWSDDIMRPSYSTWFAALEAAGSRSGDTSQKGLRWDTFRVNNLCHSTIAVYANDGSVSGKLHPSDYWVGGRAEMTERMSDGSRQGATLDMSAPLKGQVASASRTIVVTSDGTLEVTDKITALPSMDAPVEWRMLTLAKASVSGAGISLSSGKAVRTLSAESSVASVTPEYCTWSPVRPSDWVARTWDPAISGRVIAGWKLTVPAGQTVEIKTVLKR